MEQEYLTAEDVAELLKLDPETVRRWSREGKLPGSKIGDTWRYRKTDIDAMFGNANRTGG